MKPPPFEYFCPLSVADAVELLSTQENPKVLAGGQSLMAMLNLRYLLPDTLIDINQIPELAGISIEAGTARIGAMTRQRVIERDAGLLRVAPIFAEASKLIGHRQTRNRGTIGGSLCHLDPAAELATLSLLYGVDVEVAGTDGVRRKMSINEFIAGFMMPNIDSHEIVSAVEVPLWKPSHGYAFHEFARRHGDFAIASAACLLECDRSGLVERIAIAVGGVGSVPQRLPSAETFFIGKTGDAGTIEEGLDFCSELEILSDFHGGADYRLNVSRTMLRKTLKLAFARAMRPESAT